VCSDPPDTVQVLACGLEWSEVAKDFEKEKNRMELKMLGFSGDGIGGVANLPRFTRPNE